MPSNNGFRLGDDQGLPPCGPQTTKQNPKHPILDSPPSARMFSPQYGHLLTILRLLSLDVVQEGEFLGMRIQIDLPRKIADTKLTDVVLG